jgi:hypothetical protein
MDDMFYMGFIAGLGVGILFMAIIVAWRLDLMRYGSQGRAR